MAIAGVQVRHLSPQRLWIFLILKCKFVLLQALNELIKFFYVVVFAFTLHQHAYSHVFKGKDNYVGGILRV
jgi:hypothetical protein